MSPGSKYLSSNFYTYIIIVELFLFWDKYYLWRIIFRRITIFIDGLLKRIMRKHNTYLLVHVKSFKCYVLRESLVGPYLSRIF